MAAPRDHGRVLCKIWRDKAFRAIRRTAQTLYVQLLSQDNVNNAGVLPLMPTKWAKGCDELTTDDLMGDLAVLIDARFVLVDVETEEVLIRSFMRHDPGMKHPYIFKNALKCAEAVESPALRRALAVELRRIRRGEALQTAEILDPSEPVPDPEPMPSESDSNADVNPSESHSNPIDSERHSNGIPDPSESGMPSESHRDHPFVVEFVGEGESSVVGHLGGVTRAGARDAHTREDAPHTETTPPPTSPFCSRHPEGTEESCGACGSARRRYEAAESDRAAAETARHLADSRARSEAARKAAEDRARAIADCPLGCAERDGYQPNGQVCDHDPGTLDRARRGAKAARIAICRMCDDHGRRADGTECDHRKPTAPASGSPSLAPTDGPAEPSTARTAIDSTASDASPTPERNHADA